MSSRDSLDMPLGNANNGAMELDFEGVDFGNLNLDLGMSGANNTDNLDLTGGMSMPPATSNMGYAPLSALQAQSANDDFFGGQGFELHNENNTNMGMDFGLDMGVNVDLTTSNRNLPFGGQQHTSNNVFTDSPNPLDLDGLDDMDMGMGAPLTRTDTCVSHGKHHGQQQQQQQRSASMSTALDQRGAFEGKQARHYSEGTAGMSGSVPDLSFMSEADVRALEGWTGGLQ